MEENEAAKLLGKKGGDTTSKRYGKEHYRKLAEHMNKVRKEKKAAKQ